MPGALERVSSVARLRALQSQGLIDAQAFQRGVELAAQQATPEMWRRSLQRYLSALGIAMVLIGVVFFFAFNWAALHRFAKLALVALGVASSAGYAASQGLDAMRGKAALLVATVLVGPFWVVFGQAYQTGADPWNLFALWAGLTLPWVLGARFVGLWMLWLCIAVTALVLFWGQVVADAWGFGPWLALASLFGGGWLAMVRGRAQGASWLDVRWARRVLASGYLASLVVPSAALLFDEGTVTRLIGLGAYCATCVVLWRRRNASTRDLAVLTVMAATVAVLTACVLFKLLKGTDFIVVTLVMSVAIGGEVAWMAKWLRGLHRGDEPSPQPEEAS